MRGRTGEAVSIHRCRFGRRFAADRHALLDRDDPLRLIQFTAGDGTATLRLSPEQPG
jgi:hypothetical protein